MSVQDTSLERCLAGNREREWFFVRPGGNWGDHLIYVGAEKLARSLGLVWRDCDKNSFEPKTLPRGAGIYLHGGGGFNPWGSRTAFRMLERALQVECALVIQGPQTFATESAETHSFFASAMNRSAAGEFHIFARERTSADFLTAILPNSVSIHLDHDTALHLEAEDILRHASLTHTPRGRYTLVAAREDQESGPDSIRAGRASVCLDPAYYATSFPQWLRIHAFASCVISNRLHSAIVSTLLGKPVMLLAGSYHKNRSVWEFSLRERGVQWRDSMQEAASHSAGSSLRGVLARSWKVRRLLLRMRGVPAK